MMIITREIDYAIRILRQLRDGKLKATPEVCQLENLPIHFVYRILKKLDNAGIVDITRGKDGGARLTRDLGEITMYDLVAALGERRYVSACTKPGYDCEYRRDHDGKCGVHDNLTVMQDNLDDMLKGKTIIQIVED
ncbi:MAG: Rrf2 family transcriptional regulator [Clostridiales Family XIII bacterium]|jgi:Rrf2 family protein|nr:Rrf2 family transcriptional regulator [Clostridiales Family XIII bacterium]